MSQMKINDGGNLRSVESIYINDGGNLREIHTVYINDGGNLRLVFTSIELELTIRTFASNTGDGTTTTQTAQAWEDQTGNVGGGAEQLWISGNKTFNFGFSNNDLPVISYADEQANQNIPADGYYIVYEMDHTGSIFDPAPDHTLNVLYMGEDDSTAGFTLVIDNQYVIDMLIGHEEDDDGDGDGGD